MRKLIDEEVLKALNYDLPMNLKIIEAERNINVESKYSWDIDKFSNRAPIVQNGIIASYIDVLLRRRESDSNVKYVSASKTKKIKWELFNWFDVLIQLTHSGSFLISYFISLYLIYQLYYYDDNGSLQEVSLKDLVNCEYKIANNKTLELLRDSNVKEIFTQLCKECNEITKRFI